MLEQPYRSLEMGLKRSYTLVLSLVLWARGALSEPGILNVYNEEDLKRGFATREYTTIVLQQSIAFQTDNWPSESIAADIVPVAKRTVLMRQPP